MKPIKILDTKIFAKPGRAAAAFLGAEAIGKALAEANGKASAHCYNSATEIHAVAADAETRLAKSGVTLANRAGTVVVAESAVPTAKAYARHSRQALATRVTMERNTAGWMLTSVERVYRYTGPGGDESVRVKVSAAARDDIVRAALKGYTVKTAPAGAAAVVA